MKQLADEKARLKKLVAELRLDKAVLQLIEAWRRDYNESRPHLVLGNLLPAEYRTRAGTRYDTTG